MSPSQVRAIWPGGPGFSRELFRSTEAGSFKNDSVIHHDLHVGTHIESGFHRSSSGKPVHQLIPGSAWFLRAQVIDARGSKTVSEAHFAQISDNTQIALFLTDNSSRNLLFQEFTEDYIGLDSSVSEHLSKLKSLRVVGSDYISIESYQSDGSVHKNIFSNDMLALETLDLSNVAPGHFVAVLSAQVLMGSEAAQCQVSILEQSDVRFVQGAFQELLGE